MDSPLRIDLFDDEVERLRIFDAVSQRTIERDLSTLQKKGFLKHEGKDNDGVWVIVKNNVN